MKALIIGTGAAGNKAVLEVAKLNKEITYDDIVLVNSTSKDIPKDVPEEVTQVILTTTNSGCGKERSIAKEYTITAIQSEKLNLSKKAEGYDIAVVVTSLEGGTGSGSAPILTMYTANMLGLNTHLIGFTGFESDVRGLQNSVEFFQDINQNVTVQVIQNKAFLKKAGGDHFRAEQLANEELARRIQIIDGSLLNDSDHNIDTTDIHKVVNTVGYMTVESIKVTKDLMDVEDFNKLCKQMIYDSKSLRSSKPGQNRMAVILNLSPASEEAIDGNFTVLKEAYGMPYECYMHSQYDESLGEFVAFISSGMKMPLDEVKGIYDRYMAETSKVNKDQDDFFSTIGALKGNSEDSRFDMGNAIKGKSATMSKADFLSQFQTKPSSKKTKQS